MSFVLRSTDAALAISVSSYICASREGNFLILRRFGTFTVAVHIIANFVPDGNRGNPPRPTAPLVDGAHHDAVYLKQCNENAIKCAT